MRTNCLLLSLASALTLATNAKGQTYPTGVGQFDVENTYPYNMTGRLTFLHGSSPYQGSGCAIKPRSILTAAHCLYETDTGWSSNVQFERARWKSTYLALSFAKKQWILGGYQSNAGHNGQNNDYGFSRDFAGVIFYTSPGSGGYAGYWANPSLLTGTVYNMVLGYGAQYHSGLKQLRSVPTKVFFQEYYAYYKNWSAYGEGGMSGGPVFAYTNNQFYECAVFVSDGFGVRALDNEANDFINSHLP